MAPATVAAPPCHSSSLSAPLGAACWLDPSILYWQESQTKPWAAGSLYCWVGLREEQG